MSRSFNVFGIYWKLLLSFLVVIIPFGAISLKMNEYGERNVKKEIEDSIQSRVSFYGLLLENEFSRIVGMQEEYVNDRPLLKMGIADPYMSDIERHDVIVAIHERLERMINSSSYLAGADAYLPSIGRKISGSGTMYGAIPDAEYNALKAIEDRYKNPFVYWQNRLFLSFPYSNMALIGGQEPLFLIGAEIDQGQLKQVLDRFAIGGSGGSMIVGPDGSWSVASDSALIPWPAIQPLLGEWPRHRSAFVKEADIQGKTYWIAAEKSPSLGITLLSYMPASDIVGSLSFYRTVYWILCGLFLLVVAVFAYGIFLQIHQPMRRLMRAFHRVESGNWHTALTHRRRDEFGYLYVQFNSMVAKIDELIHEVYEQKFRANLSELRQLQSQINPHFLYNSFYNLYRMARNEETENVSAFSKHLGDYFYFITRTREDDIPLEEEAGFARNYVDIQTFRFMDRIAVRFDPVPESVRALPVPKLTIQPLIENAYQHGLRNTVSDGRLEVRFELEGGKLAVVVEDNGEGIGDEQHAELLRKLKSTSPDMETTGLVNVHRRIQLKHGNDSGIAVIRTERGVQVRLSIPLDGRLPDGEGTE
ncbi:histidine kinase [Paenibacillus hodogayensis]|uniref:Histidine kinase n=1 Tax=Paenibacillus hodogayensis TaxID=279208 RepID=A0ABV5W432_9BACL